MSKKAGKKGTTDAEGTENHGPVKKKPVGNFTNKVPTKCWLSMRDGRAWLKIEEYIPDQRAWAWGQSKFGSYVIDKCGGGDLFAANGHFHDVLKRTHGYAVPGQGTPVGNDFQVGLADDPVGKYKGRFHTGDLLEEAFDL